LYETQLYLESRKIKLDHYQIVQLYMVTGGIPHYLRAVQPGQSAAQAIDSLCFHAQGLLNREFERLYDSLFEHPEPHLRIIRALKGKRKGLTRKHIVDLIALPDGGRITRVLEELENSGFVSAYAPFGKRKKDALYRLTDEYSLFYMKFIENQNHLGEGTWLHLSQSQSWKAWSGYAFENICLKHVSAIKRALGISAVYTEVSGFHLAGSKDQKGLQVDLVIDRKDQVVTLCEIKFHDSPFRMSKAYAEELRGRISVFKAATSTRKQVFLTMITTFGLLPNEHSLGLVQSAISLEALFIDD
jgi:hypothetical protein